MGFNILLENIYMIILNQRKKIILDIIQQEMSYRNNKLPYCCTCESPVVLCSSDKIL